MARTRNLKPAFFKNEDLGDLPPVARLLFAGLWGLADRVGILEDRPRRLKAELLPYDDCDGDAILQSLADSPGKFIVRYEADGKKYIFIPAFSTHQNPHKAEKPAGFPPPPSASTARAPNKHGASTVQEPDKGEADTGSAPDENSSCRALNLNPSTLTSPPSTDHLKPSTVETGRVDHLCVDSKKFNGEILGCAKRLFDEAKNKNGLPMFTKRTAEDRDFLVKLAVLHVQGELAEDCILDAIEAIRQRDKLPDAPVGYLQTCMREWLKKHDKPTLGMMLASVDLPAGLRRSKTPAA